MEYTGAGIITTFKIKYDGAEIYDYHNKHTNVARDNVIGSLMPESMCACALSRRGKKTCLRENTMMLIAKHLDVASASGASSEDVMRELMRKTHCTDEKCVLAAARNMHILSAAEAGIEEQIVFKRDGPIDTSLFNDSVIQSQLYSWMYQFRDFWAYNFNMLDYAEMSMRHGHVAKTPDTLATINWEDMFAGRISDPVGMQITPAARAMLDYKKKNGIRCSSCIINSDIYNGPGKHWMALFVDARDNSATPHWTIEFFNSAAVRPESEWLEWMVKTKSELHHVNPSANIEIVCVCKIWHQHSRSECGPYSMFYTWARLNGIPANYFLENVVPDQMMFEFRHHLFNNDSVTPGEKFDFAQFAKKVRVKWDSENIVGVVDKRDRVEPFSRVST